MYFPCFIALIRRRLFRLQMLASPSSVLRCGIFVFCYCIFECNSISAEIFHIQMNKNTTLYALAFAIVFLVIYALFTFLWKFLVRSVFVREENYQTEKIREFSSAISKTLDLNEILDKTISVMKELMDVGNIYICMQDAPGQPYRGVASDQH